MRFGRSCLMSLAARFIYHAEPSQLSSESRSWSGCWLASARGGWWVLSVPSERCLGRTVARLAELGVVAYPSVVRGVPVVRFRSAADSLALESLRTVFSVPVAQAA